MSGFDSKSEIKIFPHVGRWRIDMTPGNKLHTCSGPLNNQLRMKSSSTSGVLERVGMGLSRRPAIRLAESCCQATTSKTGAFGSRVTDMRWPGWVAALLAVVSVALTPARAADVDAFQRAKAEL